MFSSFRLLEGRPERCWSSMLKFHSLKRENHSNTRARLRACSLKASWSISNDFVGVFPRKKQNFKQVLFFFKSHITISTGSQKLPSRKLTVRPIELLQEDVRLATDSWGSREQALTLSFSHSSAFGGIETSLVSFGSPPRIHKDKIDPNTDNFMICAILYFYNFILVIDTTVKNNDSEISLHFKPMRLIFINYSV